MELRPSARAHGARPVPELPPVGDAWLEVRLDYRPTFAIGCARSPITVIRAPPRILMSGWIRRWRTRSVSLPELTVERANEGFGKPQQAKLRRTIRLAKSWSFSV